MNNLIFLTIAICCVLTVRVQCLKCQAGAQVSTMSFFDYNFYNETVCPEDGSPQFCIRGEGLFLVLGVVEANVTTGLCVNASTCEGNCEDLALRLVQQGAQMDVDIGLDLSTIEITISTCDKICCNTDNCNTQTIATIKENQLNPSTATTTSNEVPETLSCGTGYALPSIGSTLDKIGCPDDVSHACLRQELTLKPRSGEDFLVGFAVGICSNSSTCVDSCIATANIFLSEALELGIDIGVDITTEKFEISSCKKICCQDNNCNNEVISEILKSDGVVEDSYSNEKGGSSANGLTTKKEFVFTFAFIALVCSAFRNIA